MKSKFAGVIAAVLTTFGLAGVPANATSLVGDTFQWQYVWEGTGFDTGTFSTNGTASTIFSSNPIFDISATDNSITLQSVGSGSIFSDGFSPFTVELVVSLLSGPGTFQSVTVNPVTNISVYTSGLPTTSPFGSSSLQVASNQLSINLNGSRWQTGGNITLDVNNVSATPLPPTWALLLTGFAGLALLGAYRKRRGRDVTGNLAAA
jgi:hypothetical protein